MKKAISVALELLGHKLRIGFQIKSNGRNSLTRRNDLIIRNFSQGYSIERLAKKYDLTESRISQVLTASGARQPKWRKLSDDARRTIYRMQKNGLSMAEIGRKVGVTRERVRQILHQHLPSR